MFAKGMMAKGKGTVGNWKAVMKPQFVKASSGTAGSNLSARNFKAEQKVWIGGLTADVSVEDLQELCGTIGKVKLAEIHGKSACVCYDTAEEAQLAISSLNGSFAGDIVLQFDSWVAEPKASNGGGWSSGNAAKDRLVARIKDFQRAAADQKQAWWDFCDEHLQGKRDPAKADQDVLENFCNSFGVPIAIQTPQTWQGGKGWVGDPVKDALVLRIKDFQRSDDASKQAWWSFCDENLNGSRDPMRADSETLQMFCNSFGVPNASQTPHTWQGGKGSMGDLTKDALIHRIKDFQRSDDTQKQVWWSFCDERLDGNRDPARADSETLQMFCGAYGVP